MIADEAKI